MEGRVVPYLKEVGLASNLPSQLQDTYVRCCIFTCICTILESTRYEYIYTHDEFLYSPRAVEMSSISRALADIPQIFCCSCSACAMAHASILKVQIKLYHMHARTLHE